MPKSEPSISQKNQLIAILITCLFINGHLSVYTIVTSVYCPFSLFPSYLVAMTAVFVVTVLVDEKSASSLTKANGRFDDIVVLHLEGGKDFFISFQATVCMCVCVGGGGGGGVYVCMHGECDLCVHCACGCVCVSHYMFRSSHTTG